MISYTKLQTESKDWVLKNFGVRPKHQPLLGMFEEYGELMLAEKLDEIKDAVADIAIFLIDFCNANDLNLDQVLYMNKKEDLSWLDSGALLAGIATSIGKIAHHYLKREQGIRGDVKFHTEQIEVRVSQLVGFLQEFSRQGSFNFEDTVQMVWRSVSKRNWSPKQLVAARS